jgi:acetylglutamate kinase
MIPKVEAALNALNQAAPWAAIAKGEPGIVQAVLQGTKGTTIRAG